MSETMSMYAWGAFCLAILLAYATADAWPVLRGKKLVLVCRVCRLGKLTETERTEKARLGCRREYECEHCGRRKWATDFARCLFGQLYVELCPKCEKAALRYTGSRKWRPFYRWVQCECIHCDHTE